MFRPDLQINAEIRQKLIFVVLFLMAVSVTVPIVAWRPMFPTMIFKVSWPAVFSRRRGRGGMVRGRRHEPWARRRRRGSCVSIVVVVPAASDEIHRNTARSVLGAVTFPMATMLIRNR